MEISDADARRTALDAARSFIIQAPAGSGKTELLTQRYLRLLALVEHPEQILAITFTRKAAAEMRTRVLRALEDAGGDMPASPHKRTTWELARAVRATDERLKWHLVDHPARLRIQTIDALSASLARRLPMLAGIGAALEPTDDPFPLYEAAARALVEQLGDGSQGTQQLERLIRHLGNRVDMLAELLSGLLAKRDQWLHMIVEARSRTDLRETLEGTLQRLVQKHLRQLCAHLDSARRQELFELLQYSAQNLLQNGSVAEPRRTWLEQALAAAHPPDEHCESLVLWRGIAAMLFTGKDEVYTTVTVRQGFPTQPRAMKERMTSMLQWLASDEWLCQQLRDIRTLPPTTYSEGQWDMLQALLAVLPQAVAELQLVFQREGQADYVEIALRALRALGPPQEPTDLALALDYRLQHILIDEFQDTSFAQLDLLERLTAGWQAGDGRTLFCVGDPMQSIYRFRQAEVGLFINLQREGLGQIALEPLRLEANFRSTPPVVEWVNATFPAVLAPADDPELGAVRYSPSVAARKELEGGVKVHALINSEESEEAAFVVDLVQQALDQDAAERVAILVTARTHVAEVAAALTRARIAFRAVEIEQLRERPVVQDLMALTRALVHLGDRTAWLAVLRAPWCGLTLPDLHAVAEAGDGVVHEAVAEVLANIPDDLFAPTVLSAEGRNRLERVHKILEAALAERGRWPLRIWVERTWNALGGPATLLRREDVDDAEAFLARLEHIEIAGDLADVARLEERLNRLFASGQLHGQPRVEIMTVHAAKGLEFDTVILPGLQRGSRGEDRELLRWARIAGAEGGMLLAPIKAEGSEPDAIYRWIELLERERVERERARLLYVAVTRAKRMLHLIGSAQARQRDDEMRVQEPRRGSMLRMLWRSVASYFDAAVQTASEPISHMSTLRQGIRRLPLNWRAPDVPLCALPAATTAPPDFGDERPVFDWASEISRHIGTLVHRKLDRLCRAPTPGTFVVSGGTQERLRLELEELGVPPDRTADAVSRVISAIERTLSDDRGRWLLGLNNDIREARSELALTGVVSGRLVAGIIDRTFIDADETCWIVDFKTSTHEGGGLEQFLDDEVLRYRDQLRRYGRLIRLTQPGRTVKAALYFPLLGAWREVPIDA